MDFTPTQEQRMIADSFARVFAEAQTEPRWATFCALELVAATWPEARGGAAFTLGDMVPALMETGRAAAVEPVIGCAILPGLMLARAGAAAPDLPGGTLCVADGAELTQSGEALSGRLRAVPGGAEADHVLICLSGDIPAVFRIDWRDAYALVDGRGAADITLDAARPVAIGKAVPGLAEWARDAAATAFAADALGAMLAVRDLTLDYLKQRKQFGRPLGSFQVLQHAMVDFYHDTEHFQSLVLLAARACDEDDTVLRMRAVSSAKRYLGGRIRRSAASAIQLHGGIGMTEDYALGARVKRVLVADMLNGSADAHAVRLAGIIAQETRADMTDLKENCV